MEYPVRVRGELSPGLSRWLWLVKWLLVIPHYVVLAFLWLAAFAVWFLAFFAILLTGRFPRALFDFQVGVLRWSWRVAFYGYAAIGTDRYPPFSLASDPSYPADLEVEYPERLSRGLVLVKWWLLAIPHYLVVSIFTGSFTWGLSEDSPWLIAAGWGLIGLLVFAACVVLLFTGGYPPSLFDFVLGLDRWVLRVLAYAGLMTDRYPPFSLDQGPDEPGAVPAATGETTVVPGAAPAVASTRGSRWTAGRVVAVVLGSIAALAGAAIVAAGVITIVVDRTQRDDDGFVMSPSETFASDGYAVVSESVDVALEGEEALARSFVGTVKIESESARPAFLGIARAEDADGYLDGVRHSVVTEIGTSPRYDDRPGTEPATPPGEQSFWATSVTGAGTQALTWEPESGDWVAVLMNPDASADVRARLSIGAELDPLLWIGIGVLAVGAVVFLLGVLGIALGASRARR
jgi:hypothetical protein